MKKCPKCGSEHAARILYGEPSFDEERQCIMENIEIILGGYRKSDYDPEYRCLECGRSFGVPPVLLSRRGEEDYRDIVTSIMFSDSGYFGGYHTVRIEKKEDGILMTVQSLRLISTDRPDGKYRRRLKEYEWKHLVNHLYCSLCIHEWDKHYDDPDVCDGEQWELHIGLTGRRVRNYGGSNAFPPYWTELKATFWPFFKVAGIRL